MVLGSVVVRWWRAAGGAHGRGKVYHTAARGASACGNPASRDRARLEWPGASARLMATWRPVDLTTWTRSASRQVDKSKGRRAGTGRAGARPSRTAAGRQHDRIDRIDRRSGPNAARGAGVRDPAGKGRRRRPCAPACPDSSRRRPPPSSPAHAGRTGPDCA